MFSKMENFINIWHSNLGKHPEAIDFLFSRGVSEEQIKIFKIGWSPRAVKISRAGKIYYDGDRNETGYVLFPLTSYRRTMGFISRSVDGKEYYKWRLPVPGPWFFGLNQTTLKNIWDTRQVFLVEGAFDLFPLQRIYPNTLCLGSANLSIQQNIFLERFVDKVFLYLDSDDAGKRGAEKIKHFANKYKCVILKQSYKDIGEAWWVLGDEKLQKIVHDQVSYYDL